jgi:hypothetical protein
MQESIVNTPPRRRIARRIGAAVLALAAVLTLGACRATGGGYLAPDNILFKGQADFGFNFTCEVETENKRAVIRGEITYHDRGPVTVGTKTFPEGIRIHGTVDPFFIELANLTELPPGTDLNCANAGVKSGLADQGRARFRGEYRSQDTMIPATERTGRFQVDVQDLGEPTNFDGDTFEISLTSGPYAPYNRFGIIEGGNIQVEED